MNISDPDFHVPNPLSLSENEVQVWRLDLEAVAPALNRWQEVLSSDEQARAKRYLSPMAHRSFTLTRALLRTVLAAYLDADRKQLTFHLSAKDKPALGPPYAESGITFNVSHASGVALLAFSRKRALGVDVECIHRDLEFDDIARRFFSPYEQAALAEVSLEEKPAAFFRCWTRKEAYIKAKGEGLSLPLGEFDVSLASGDTNALLSTRPDGDEAARWSLREVPAGKEYVGALCVAGHDWRLRDWSQDAAG